MFTSLENLKSAINYNIISKELKHDKYGKRYKYIIELKRKNKKILFSFTDIVYSYQHGMALNILDLINCLLLDMHAYDNNETLKDFAWCFGYNMDDIKNINQTKKIYNACKINAYKIHNLFNENELNMLDNLFQEY